MTPLELQDELVSEMKSLFKNCVYKVPGGELVHIKVFPQDIPMPETDEDEEPIPYLIVRMTKGSDTGEKDSFNEVHVVIIIGVYDDDLLQQGYRDAMNAIQKIYERFHKDPNLNNKAVYTGEFDWALQEDAYFPYFFAACKMSFDIPAIRREDPLA